MLYIYVMLYSFRWQSIIYYLVELRSRTKICIYNLCVYSLL